MAKRFLRSGLILVLLIAALGVNLWWLTKKDFANRLSGQTPRNRFCHCLAGGDVCRNQASRYSKKELRRWEELVKNDPAYPDSWAKLATIWLYEGRYDLAEMTIKRAVDLAPFRDDLKKLKKQIENVCN